MIIVSYIPRIHLCNLCADFVREIKIQEVMVQTFYTQVPELKKIEGPLWKLSVDYSNFQNISLSIKM